MLVSTRAMPGHCIWAILPGQSHKSDWDSLGYGEKPSARLVTQRSHLTSLFSFYSSKGLFLCLEITEGQGQWWQHSFALITGCHCRRRRCILGPRDLAIHQSRGDFVRAQREGGRQCLKAETVCPLLFLAPVSLLQHQTSK